MKDDIIINPAAEACLTDSFDERAEKNNLIEEMDKELRSYANTLSKQGQRIEALEDQGNILLCDAIEQGEDIEKMKEELRTLRARSESARDAIESIHELLDNEFRALKIFSMGMCILFFLILVINIVSRLVG